MSHTTSRYMLCLESCWHGGLCMPTPNCSIRRSFPSRKIILRFTFFSFEYAFHHLRHLFMYVYVWCRRTKLKCGWLKQDELEWLLGQRRDELKKRIPKIDWRGKSVRRREMFGVSRSCYSESWQHGMWKRRSMWYHTHTHSHTARCSLANEQAAVWSP